MNEFEDDKRPSLRQAQKEAAKLQLLVEGGHVKDYAQAAEHLEKDLVTQVCRILESKYGEGVHEESIFNWLRDLEEAFGTLAAVKGKRILDVGCGSTLPPEAQQLAQELISEHQKGVHIENDQRLAALRKMQRESGGRFSEDILISLFKNDIANVRIAEPWFPRLLLELGAQPVGIDVGNLGGERFEYHNVDLSKKKALDFLPSKSFDAVHSRGLFTSAQLESMANDRVQAMLHKEIQKQYTRLLKDGGKILNLKYPEIFH